MKKNYLREVENNHDKIRVAIAAKQFFSRFGIKTILSFIGIEPEVLESGSFDRLTKIVKKNPDIKYIVINEDILPCCRYKCIEEVIAVCPAAKLLIIGDGLMENCKCSQYINNDNSQKMVIEKFQDFFFEPDPEYNQTDNLLLSEREIDVLKLVSKGFLNKEIADKLNISINTVITHRKNITEKLGIKTIAGLTVYAMINNLIIPGDVR